MIEDTEGETVAVPSSSRPNVTYYVSFENGVPRSCTCPHHTYRQVVCKHMDPRLASAPPPRPRRTSSPPPRQLGLFERPFVGFFEGAKRSRWPSFLAAVGWIALATVLGTLILGWLGGLIMLIATMALFGASLGRKR